MTSPDTHQDEPGNPGPWLECLAACLAAAGFPGRVTETAGGASLAVTVSWPGRRETEVIVDADGYCELRWWLPPGIPSGQATDAITSVITAALHAAHAPAAAS
ncbi:MAG TPA: hypothetical protein VGG25_29130 [Streptosporangiaceae bacterium]|jgi:hypothetical protein